MHTRNFLFGKISWPLIGLLMGLAVGITLFGSGFDTRLQKQAKSTLDNIKATVLTEPRDIAQFHLVDNNGKPFTNAQLNGHWSLIFFGFTRCGMICPTTMAEAAKIYQLLAKEKALAPQFWMISIDPARDDVARMNTYVKAFNPQFHGATGNEAQIATLAKSMSVVYVKVNQEGNKNPKDYQVDHSGAIMLINPQGKLIAFFTMPHEAKTFTADLIKIENYFA